jgi:hypothetical protein
MQEQLWPSLWYNIICTVWLKKMENLSQDSLIMFTRISLCSQGCGPQLSCSQVYHHVHKTVGLNRHVHKSTSLNHHVHKSIIMFTRLWAWIIMFTSLRASIIMFTSLSLCSQDCGPQWSCSQVYKPQSSCSQDYDKTITNTRINFQYKMPKWFQEFMK